MALLFLDVGEYTWPSMLEHRRSDPWLHQLEVGQCVLASSLIGATIEEQLAYLKRYR